MKALLLLTLPMQLCWLFRTYEKARRLGTTDEERNAPLRLMINKFEYLITHLEGSSPAVATATTVLFESKTAQVCCASACVWACCRCMLCICTLTQYEAG